MFISLSSLAVFLVVFLSIRTVRAIFPNYLKDEPVVIILLKLSIFTILVIPTAADIQSFTKPDLTTILFIIFICFLSAIVLSLCVDLIDRIFGKNKPKPVRREELEESSSEFTDSIADCEIILSNCEDK